ncbi:Carbohydrate ABC transporter permease OS=Streptomyces tendae OX=1932 GN=GUR47_31540 PE=3 SV=1 [Streptomyces tendae]
MRTSTAARTGQYAALLGYLVFLAFPFLWLISIAFKPPRELASLHPAWIPEDPTLDNFRQAFDEQPLLRAGLNFLLAALGAALIAVLIATPMAYVMARRRGRLTKAATGWVVVSQPLAQLRAADHPAVPGPQEPRPDQLRSRPGDGVRRVVAAVRAVDAGRIRPRRTARTGGGRRGRRRRTAGTLVSVTAPLLAPGIVATALFAFITAWNEFFFALVLLKTPEKQTLPVILTHFIGAEGVADLAPPRRPSSRPCPRWWSSRSSSAGSRAACSPGR